MKLLLWGFLCACAIISAQSDVETEEFEVSFDWDALYKYEQEQVELNTWESVLNTIKEKLSPPLYKIEVTNSAHDCGSSSSIIHFDSLTTSPSYVPVPGNLSLSGHVVIDQDLAAPISASLTLRRKIGGWIHKWVRVPCTHGVGSCSYSDLCHSVPFKVPCKCPLASGDYHFANFSIYISRPTPHIPIPLTGDYEVTLNLNHGGSPIGCLYLAIRLEKR